MSFPTDGREVLYLDPDYEGSCPCATFELEGTKIELHCWRVCMDDSACGIHYEGDRSVAERIKPLLDEMDWYGEWNIREGFGLSADAA